jgi:hypothetical protein
MSRTPIFVRNVSGRKAAVILVVLFHCHAQEVQAGPALTARRCWATTDLRKKRPIQENREDNEYRKSLKKMASHGSWRYIRRTGHASPHSANCALMLENRCADARKSLRPPCCRWRFGLHHDERKGTLVLLWIAMTPTTTYPCQRSRIEQSYRYLQWQQQSRQARTRRL